MKNGVSPALIALTALLIALTTVFTLLVRVPIPATQGYVNLSDVAITFTGLIFGPWVGLAAGGIGAGLADLLGGYAQFAPLSLVAHGLEGLAIGWLGRGRKAPAAMIAAWLVGAAVMVAGYLLGEGLFLTGWPAAIAEVPMNALQAIVGAVVGIPLVFAVRQAYPPIDRLGQRRTWRE
ncbi:MAG: ECF transporter S component [Anaerolineae bacterium]|nr:ECF transporter S component [Anaerolineae bacterium]